MIAHGFHNRDVGSKWGPELRECIVAPPILVYSIFVVLLITHAPIVSVWDYKGLSVLVEELIKKPHTKPLRSKLLRLPYPTTVKTIDFVPMSSAVVIFVQPSSEQP